MSKETKKKAGRKPELFYPLSDLSFKDEFNILIKKEDNFKNNNKENKKLKENNTTLKK